MTLQDWANLSTALGVPTFIITILLNFRRERLEAEYGTFDALQREYIDFLKLAIEHPRLDMADCRLANPPADLSDIEITTRKNLYLILISTLERAFLKYRQTSRRARAEEYAGWDAYLDNYLERPGFLEAFFNDGPVRDQPGASQFSRAFEAEVIRKLKARGRLKQA